jgi:hypothetical protein
MSKTKKRSTALSNEDVIPVKDFVMRPQFEIQFSEPQFSMQYIVEQPQFKFCKKRKEFFSNEYEQVWYKSPYKYNMRMKMTSVYPYHPGEFAAKLSLTHEDGSLIKCKGEAISVSANPVLNSRKKSGKKNNVMEFSSDSDSEEESTGKASIPTNIHDIKFGPFQFNVCSYKCDGKKFRLMVHLYMKADNKKICCLSSPAFLIKAKKPIAKPGIKSFKRSYEEMKKEECVPSASESPVQASSPVPSCNGIVDPSISFMFQQPLLNIDMQRLTIESQLFPLGSILNNFVHDMSQVANLPEEQETKRSRFYSEYSTELVMDPNLNIVFQDFVFVPAVDQLVYPQVYNLIPANLLCQQDQALMEQPVLAEQNTIVDNCPSAIKVENLADEPNLEFFDTIGIDSHEAFRDLMSITNGPSDSNYS